MWLASPSAPGPVARRVFPPALVVAVKAIACELPARLGLPLGRLHVPDIRSEVIRRGFVASISDTTIWRWLSEDAIRPWTHRSWIFPRDPEFGPKAARVLDLYARTFEGRPLRSDEYVISADEKTSIQARIRRHPTLPPAAGRAMLVEFEYKRGGALQYLAAWDVHRAKLFGRCEAHTGAEPFDRLVDQVMSSEPYASARRVFWIVDNGPSHRGQPSTERLEGAYPNLRLIHLPIHASWLNQVEIYFKHPRAQGPHAARRGLARGARRPDPRLRSRLRGPRPAVRVEVHQSRSRHAPRTPADARGGVAGGGVNTSPNIRATALKATAPMGRNAEPEDRAAWGAFKWTCSAARLSIARLEHRPSLRGKGQVQSPGLARRTAMSPGCQDQGKAGSMRRIRLGSSFGPATHPPLMASPSR